MALALLGGTAVSLYFAFTRYPQNDLRSPQFLEDTLLTRNGQIVTAPGAANSAALIGTVVPGTGNVTNGVLQAGNGIADTSYVWPKLAVGPPDFSAPAESARKLFVADVTFTSSVMGALVGP